MPGAQRQTTLRRAFRVGCAHITDKDMGYLLDGTCHDEWHGTDRSGGRFIRSDSRFRNWITADGNAGPTGNTGFKVTAGRYHLIVSLACPWANRTTRPRPEGADRHDQRIGGESLHGRERGDLRTASGVRADPVMNARYPYQLYQWPDIAATISLSHIKQHHYRSHPSINPNRIAPLGPVLDWMKATPNWPL